MPADPEIKAIVIVCEALEPLEDDVRRRVLKYVGDRFGFAPAVSLATQALGAPQTGALPVGTPSSAGGAEIGAFNSIADAFSAAGPPKAGPEKVLLVAAYLQARGEHAEGFRSRDISNVLKDLGHPVANTTDTLNSLISRRPQWVTQLRKAGSSRQAQKIYKVTAEGFRVVNKLTAAEVS